MRPIDRGPNPTITDPLTGAVTPVTFSEYAEARPYLREKVGMYCCYCEVPLNGTLAVEHIVAKSTSPALICTWANLLLVCNNCNSVKTDHVAYPPDLTLYYWPDQDPTFHVFAYQASGKIDIHATILGADRIKALRTIALTGLDRDDTHGLTAEQKRKDQDLRYLHRRQTWRIAIESRARLKRSPSADMRASILDLAISRGFWSVWMTVFKDDAQMLTELVSAFTGTDPSRVFPLPW